MGSRGRGTGRRHLEVSGSILEAIVIVKVLRLCDLALQGSDVEQHTAPLIHAGHLGCGEEDEALHVRARTCFQREWGTYQLPSSLQRDRLGQRRQTSVA